MGVGQNGHDFNVNGLVHVHGGTVTLPREVRFVPESRETLHLQDGLGLG